LEAAAAGITPRWLASSRPAAALSRLCRSGRAHRLAQLVGQAWGAFARARIPAISASSAAKSRLKIEQRSLDPMKLPQTGFHPTRRFTLVALNAEFAADSGRPRRHYRTAASRRFLRIQSGC
jgi:hypothetical protein